MKRLLTILTLYLLIAISVQAQNTSVSATVTDAGSVVWANGTYSFNFVPSTNAPNGPFFNNGVPYTPTTLSGSLSGSGAFTQSVPSNSTITPSGSFWIVTYCPQATAACQNSGKLTITGGSQNISASFIPAALVVQPGANQTVYNTNEVGTSIVGSQIYLIGTGLETCSAVTGTVCNTWVSSGGGGGGASPTQTYIYASDPKYGIVWDTHFVCDATWGSGTQTVTFPVGEVMPTTEQASAGYVIWGTPESCSNATTTNPVVRIPFGTITNVTGQTVTFSTTTTLGCTPANRDGCAVVWGPPPQTTQLNNAWNDAANACGILLLPGLVIIDGPIHNSTSTCPAPAGGNDFISSVGVVGTGGYSSGVAIAPTFTVSCGTCLFTMPNWAARKVYKNFAVISFTPAPAADANSCGLRADFSSEVSGIWMNDWWWSSTNAFTAICALSQDGALTSVHDNLILSSGQIGISATGGEINIFNNWVQGQQFPFAPQGSGIGPIYSWNNTWYFAQQSAILESGNTTILFSDNDIIGQGSNASPLDLSGVAHFRNLRAGGSATSGIATVRIRSGAVVTMAADSPGESFAAGGSNGTGILNAGTLTLTNVASSGQGTGDSINNSGTLNFIGNGNSASGGAGLVNTGTITGGLNNCSSSAAPAVCANAVLGSVAIAAAATSVVVDTTGVTANSQITVTEDEGLGTKLGVTCNTQALTTLGAPRVTARTAGTSFTISIDVGPTTNPMCISYQIVN